MSLVRDQQANVVDLTNLESCRNFRQQLDNYAENSASDAETQYRSQDEQECEEDDDWDSDEESNTNSSWRGEENDDLLKLKT